jgi:hypothetical protein
MSNPAGSRRLLAANHRLVNDLLYFSAKTPLVPVERRFDLAELAALRDSAPARISWTILFIKAYGLLSQRHPHLRRAYMAWPWPHLYEHPLSVAMLAINRPDANEDRLFWGRFLNPEMRSLPELQHELERYKSEPVQTVFRRQIRLARFPLPLRRIAWWLTLNSGPKLAKRFGTFGLSTLAGMGAYNGRHPACLTTSFSYGPLEPGGQMLVTILFDHRILDGAAIARDLADLESILKTEVSAELRELSGESSSDPTARRAA